MSPGYQPTSAPDAGQYKLPQGSGVTPADWDAHRRELQARNTELVERARRAEADATFWKVSAAEWQAMYESARDRATALRTMLDMRKP